MPWHGASEKGLPSPNPILLTCQLGLLNFSLEIKILWNNKPHLLNMEKKYLKCPPAPFIVAPWKSLDG